jgi:K+-transporting ATPase KdpF subunit
MYAMITAENQMIIWYIAGAVIALFILGYLIYTLIRPEKF